MKKLLVGLLILSQGALGAYVTGGGTSSSGGGGTWGSITGTLSSQTDLQTELDARVSDSATETIAGVKTFSSAPICSSLTATTVPYLDASKQLTSSAVTPTELGYVSGVTSALQTQLGAKAPTASPSFTGVVTIPNGSVSAPGAIMNAETGTGLYRISTNNIGFAANGGLRLKFGNDNGLSIYDNTNAANNFLLIDPTSAGTTFSHPNISGRNTFTVNNQFTSEDTKFKLLNGSYTWRFNLTGTAQSDDQEGWLQLCGGLGDWCPIQVTNKNSSIILGRLLANARPNNVTVYTQDDVTNIGGTTTANASTTITGSGTDFLQLGLGDRISLSSASSTYATITAIASATSLTVDTALGNGTSQTINRKFAPMAVRGAGSQATMKLLNDQGRLLVGDVATQGGPTAQLQVSNGSGVNDIFDFKDSTSSILKGADGGVVTASTSIVSPIFSTSTSTPATAGTIRLAKTDSISWRNTGNTANTSLSINALNDYVEITSPGGTKGLIVEEIRGAALTGSVLNVTNGTAVASDGEDSFNWDNRQLINSSGNITASWGTNLAANTSISTVSKTVDLTADNQSVTVNDKSFVRFTSDNATATNRTMVLGDGVADGQHLVLAWAEDTSTGQGELPDSTSNNVRLSAAWTCNGIICSQGATLNLIWDSADSNWLEIGRGLN